MTEQSLVNRLEMASRCVRVNADVTILCELAVKAIDEIGRLQQIAGLYEAAFAELKNERNRLDWALKHNAGLPFTGTHMMRLSWFEADGYHDKATQNIRATIDELMQEVGNG